MKVIIKVKVKMRGHFAKYMDLVIKGLESKPSAMAWDKVGSALRSQAKVTEKSICPWAFQ